MVKVWSRSPDLSSRPAMKLFKVCQSFAKTVAKSVDLFVLWHFPDDVLIRAALEQRSGVQKRMSGFGVLFGVQI